MGRSMHHFVASVLGACLTLTPFTFTLAVSPRQVGTFQVSTGTANWTPTGTLTATIDPKATADQLNGRADQVGQLVSFGSVTVNNRPAPSGSSVFSNSLIKVPCVAGSSAIIRIGTAAVLELKAGSQLQLTFSDGLIGGDLREGSLRVRTQPGVRLALNTPDGLVSTDGQKAAFTPVAARSSSRCQFDQLATLDNPGATTAGQGPARRSGQTAPTRAGAAASSINPAALAALIFGVGVAGAITIAALTDSGYQVSPINP